MVVLRAEDVKKAFFQYGYRPRQPNEIWVTEIVACMRRAFFGVYFNAVPVLNVGRVVVGRLLHEMLPKVLGGLFDSERYDWEKDVSVDLGGGYRLVGRVDAISVSDGTVFEFKFTRLGAQKAHPLYMAQANTYSGIVGSRRYYLVLIDRERFDVEVVEGEFDEDAYKAVLDRCREVIRCIEEGRIPPKAEFDWLCKGCPYNVICSNLREEGG
ncbi:MAG: CRISPR-associated protein Cas4 [Methanotrichaceae archaeon]